VTQDPVGAGKELLAWTVPQRTQERMQVTKNVAQGYNALFLPVLLKVEKENSSPYSAAEPLLQLTRASKSPRGEAIATTAAAWADGLNCSESNHLQSDFRPNLHGTRSNG
jgi:hypothetical protein